jgi:hypothetical protein
MTAAVQVKTGPEASTRSGGQAPARNAAPGQLPQPESRAVEPFDEVFGAAVDRAAARGKASQTQGRERNLAAPRGGPAVKSGSASRSARAGSGPGAKDTVHDDGPDRSQSVRAEKGSGKDQEEDHPAKPNDPVGSNTALDRPRSQESEGAGGAAPGGAAAGQAAEVEVEPIGGPLSAGPEIAPVEADQPSEAPDGSGGEATSGNAAEGSAAPALSKGGPPRKDGAPAAALATASKGSGSPGEGAPEDSQEPPALARKADLPPDALDRVSRAASMAPGENGPGGADGVPPSEEQPATARSESPERAGAPEAGASRAAVAPALLGLARGLSRPEPRSPLASASPAGGLERRGSISAFPGSQTITLAETIEKSALLELKTNLDPTAGQGLAAIEPSASAAVNGSPTAGPAAPPVEHGASATVSAAAPGLEATGGPAPAGSSAPQDPAGQPVLDLGEGKARWTDRMAVLVRGQLRAGGGQLRMVLKPPRLGQLDLKLAMRGTQLRLSIGVESNAVRHLLASGAGELKESLKQAGVEVERIHITVGDDDGRPGQRGDGRSSGGGAGGEERREETAPVLDRPKAEGLSGPRALSSAAAGPEIDFQA